MSKAFFNPKDKVSYDGIAGFITLIDKTSKWPIEVEFKDEHGKTIIGYFDYDGKMKHGDGSEKKLIKQF